MSRGVTNIPFAASSSENAAASTTVGTPMAMTGTPSVSTAERGSVVAHAGAGDDTRVGELYRGAEPVQRRGGEGVYGYYLRCAHALADGLYHLGALDARSAEHSRADGADGGQSLELLRHGALEVPGGEGVLHRQRPDRVGRHGRVAQPGDQRQLARLRQQFAQQLGEGLRPVGEGLRPALSQRAGGDW